MKFSTEHLPEALLAIRDAIPKNSALPILACVRIEAAGDTLTLTGSNLETEIRAAVSAEVETPGACCINAATLYAIAGNAQPGGIHLVASGGAATIRTPSSRHTLNTLSAEDYPLMMDAPDAPAVELYATAITRAIGLIEHAVARDAVRYYLNGVFLALRPGGITLTASDGHRLATIDLTHGADLETSAIVPLAAVRAIARAGKQAGVLTLRLTRETIRVDIAAKTITAKCIAAQYPDMSRILNPPPPHQTRVDARALACALLRVTATANEHIATRVTIGDHLIHLECLDSSGQESESDTPCDYAGEPHISAFCATYLLDALRQIDGQAILEFGGQLGPAIIRPAEAGHKCLIAPMRI